MNNWKIIFISLFILYLVEFFYYINSSLQTVFLGIISLGFVAHVLYIGYIITLHEKKKDAIKIILSIPVLILLVLIILNIRSSLATWIESCLLLFIFGLIYQIYCIKKETGKLKRLHKFKINLDITAFVLILFGLIITLYFPRFEFIIIPGFITISTVLHYIAFVFSKDY